MRLFSWAIARASMFMFLFNIMDLCRFSVNFRNKKQTTKNVITLLSNSRSWDICFFVQYHGSRFLSDRSAGGWGYKRRLSHPSVGQSWATDFSFLQVARFFWETFAFKTSLFTKTTVSMYFIFGFTKTTVSMYFIFGFTKTTVSKYLIFGFT